ncbi:MAG TPA: nitroreductase family protein [Flavobacteriaceae bacterium]|nr:nitroreductase family protein [Flavobacteriaceae bacterium]
MITRIKNKIHALVFWQTRIGELFNKMYDLRLFYKYSFDKNHLKNQGRIEHYLTKQYHIIEKGLALPKPRPEFGKDVISNLVIKSTEYYHEYGKSKLIESISACLNEYLIFNKKNNIETNNKYYTNIKKFVTMVKPNKLGGTKIITKQDINKAIDFDFEVFLRTRTSIRDFSDKNVDINQLKEVINLAKLAPSVCNRQGWKAHVYNNSLLIKELLTLQNGNRGFTDSVNKLIIITGNTKAFTKLESNQIYIDGGIFSMNVLLSLHSAGLGAVALNTCLPYTIEKKVKKTGNIKDFEKLIMMIAVGEIKDNFKVAVSNRKHIDSIYKAHQ